MPEGRRNRISQHRVRPAFPYPERRAETRRRRIQDRRLLRSFFRPWKGISSIRARDGAQGRKGHAVCWCIFPSTDVWIFVRCQHRRDVLYSMRPPSGWEKNSWGCMWGRKAALMSLFRFTTVLRTGSFSRNAHEGAVAGAEYSGDVVTNILEKTAWAVSVGLSTEFCFDKAATMVAALSCMGQTERRQRYFRASSCSSFRLFSAPMLLNVSDMDCSSCLRSA